MQNPTGYQHHAQHDNQIRPSYKIEPMHGVKV